MSAFAVKETAQNIGNDAAGASAGAASLVIPATTLSGNYFLLACSDDLKVSPESNETNNCKASSTTVQIS